MGVLGGERGTADGALFPMRKAYALQGIFTREQFKCETSEYELLNVRLQFEVLLDVRLHSCLLSDVRLQFENFQM